MNVLHWLSQFFPKKTTFQSKINGEITVYEFLWKKNLFAGGVTQSGGFADAMWKEALKNVRSRMPEVRKCLVLGVGGGTVINLLKQTYPTAEITGIEKDEQMVKAARQIFHMNLFLVDIIISDAFKWVDNHREEKYNLIVVDLYIGRFNPKKSHTLDFLKNIKKLLKRDGIVLFNCHYQENNPAEYKKFIKRCVQIFSTCKEIALYPLSRLILLG